MPTKLNFFAETVNYESRVEDFLLALVGVTMLINGFMLNDVLVGDFFNILRLSLPLSE